MPRYISDRSILNPRRAVMPFLETLPPYLTRIVVGDLHGDLEGLRALLAHLGVLDRFSKRCDGFHIAQLGDLIHGGHHEERADRQMLEEVLERGWLDEVLCGNHELWPAFHLPSGRWEGMTDPPDQKVVELLQQLRLRGGLTAASAVDGWLLTHAGLHPLYQKRVPAGLRMTAVDLATYLCAAFEARIGDRSGRDLFDAVGPVRSGGRDPLAGGIFWADAYEMATAKPRNRVPQIFGHTPQGNAPVQMRPDMWCADVGAALSGLVCALVKKPLEADWVPVVVRSPDGPRRSRR
jgi:hypothetical protein